MTNVASIPGDVDVVRVRRATYLRDDLTAERWSIRKAATGMSVSVLASRLNGTTSILAEEIESLARLLKADPARLYATYLAAGDDESPETRKAPTPKGEGLVHPLGLEPRTHWLLDGVAHGRFGDHPSPVSLTPGAAGSPKSARIVRPVAYIHGGVVA